MLRRAVVGRVLTIAATLRGDRRCRARPAAPGRAGLRRARALPDASQLVKGNLVQVAGAPVGHGHEDQPHRRRPGRGHDEDRRRRATRRCAAGTPRDRPPGVAVRRRQPLRRPPARARHATREDPRRRRRSASARRPPPSTSTSSSTSSTRARARRCSGVIRGFGNAVTRAAPRRRQGWRYLNPSLAASSRLFERAQPRHAAAPALHRRDRRTSSPTSPQRRDDLAGLVDNLATTTRRARPPQARARATRSAGCPTSCAGRTRRSSTCARRSTTSTRSSTSPSRCAKKLRPVPRRAAPARPRRAPDAPRPLAARSRRPGADNDLIELTSADVPLRDIAVGAGQRNGKQREGAFPASTKALAGVDARARLRAALRARPHRLVRRLQPLRRLRRARRREPRRRCTSTLFALDVERRRSRRSRPTLRDQVLRAGRAQLGPETTAARAPPSARRRLEPVQADAGLQLRPDPGAARASEARARASVVVVCVARRRVVALTSAAPSSDERQHVLGRARQRLRPDPGRRPQDRRRPRGQDHRRSSSTATRTRALVGIAIDQAAASARCAPTSHCESRPQSLIGEYFLDCQPGTARERAQARRARSRSRHTAVDDPARPRQQHPAPARARAPAPHLNELGAGLAGRGRDLNAAIRRARARRCARPTSVLRDPRPTRTRSLARPRPATPTR